MKEKREKSHQQEGRFRGQGFLLVIFAFFFTIPECYDVTLDVEDDYFKIRTTAQVNKEMKEHRQGIARAASRSKLVENLTVEKDKLSSIVFRRKSQEQREILCARKILDLRNETDRKLESVVKCQANLEFSRNSKTKVPETKQWRYQTRKGSKDC